VPLARVGVVRARKRACMVRLARVGVGGGKKMDVNRVQGASPLSAALVVGPAFELLPPAGGGECSFFQ
jgi:hypothetical protein